MRIPPKLEETSMPKRITPLSETRIRTAKSQKKEYKIFDGGGLFLLVTPTGGKLWRLKYRFEGKGKLLALGAYPEISLAHAVRDPNGRAYNRTAHLEERRKMMQTWADYLDGLKADAVVIPFKTAKG